MLVVTLIKYKPPTYGDYHYDEWGSLFGWCIALVSLVPIPVVGLLQLWKGKGTILEVRVVSRISLSTLSQLLSYLVL